jgi:hypothetical protein
MGEQGDALCTLREIARVEYQQAADASSRRRFGRPRHIESNTVAVQLGDTETFGAITQALQLPASGAIGSTTSPRCAPTPNTGSLGR